MSFDDRINDLCFNHIEKDDPISWDDLAWLIDTVVVLRDRLQDAGVLIAALSVYGEDASLPALVRGAKSQVDAIADALKRGEEVVS
jgi:predicted GTPase